LTESTVPPATNRSTENDTPNWISNTSEWSDQQVESYLDQIKVDHLGWGKTEGSARKWWQAFESENKTRMRLVVRLAEELKHRKSTITAFFLAYVYSGSDNIEANLHYLDYTTLKKKEEEQKKKKRKPESTDS
jgi:hypothetical protein